MIDNDTLALMRRAGVGINILGGWTYQITTEKGFNDKPLNIGETLMLIVTEVAEAMEEVRDPDFTTDSMRAPDGKPIGIGSELADIVIRTMHLAERLGIDLGEEVVEKLRYNETRSFRHGKRL